MRQVDRSSVNPPSSLTEPSAAVLRERADSAAYYAHGIPAKAYDFRKYKDFDVKTALRQLFGDKCAYCELDMGDAMEVEHFRPKGAVEGEPMHPGYWWLALHWENLLPSCVGCNQRRSQYLVTVDTTEAEYAAFQAKKSNKTAGKGDHFPISGARAFSAVDSLAAESHDILDPTIDDPGEYLSWSTSSTFSVALPVLSSDPLVTKRGLATIDVFALNRTLLVQSRTKALRELQVQAAEIVSDLEEDAIHGGLAYAVRKARRRAEALRRHCAPDKEFTAMARNFIEGFTTSLLARVAKVPSDQDAPADPQPAE